MYTFPAFKSIMTLDFKSWNSFDILASLYDIVVQHWFLLIILAWELRRVVVVFHGERPINIRIIGTPTVIGSWLTSLRYCFKAQSIHNKAYKEANHKPYAVPSRDRYHICVSSQKQIEELTQASIHELSFQAAVFERVFPPQTINGLQFGESDQNGSVSQKVFRDRLRTHLPNLHNLLSQRLEEAFAVEMPVDITSTDWKKIPVASTFGRIAGRMNNIIIVGDKLAGNPEFFETSMQYIHNAILTEEVLQFTPSILFPVVSYVIMNFRGAAKNIDSFLTSLVSDRLMAEKEFAQKEPDAVQWTIDCSKKSSPKSIARQVQAFVFGSSHQMPMLIQFALYNLCKYPEYIQPLREEIERAVDLECNFQNKDLPLMDSFIKETARLNPPTIIGVPRQVMTPFTFSDGTHIPSKNWVVIPQQSLMKDPANYSDPEAFNGFRFVTEENNIRRSESRFSHPSWKFPFWGSVKQSCPARFYVSMLVKMIMVHVLSNYDIKLADENIPDSFAWGVARVPHPRLALLVRRRSSSSARID